MSKARIVIVGAGAAGLAAASRLWSKGLKNILVLESANRLGGRIHSFGATGESLELGARWIHGEKGNVVFDLARDLDLCEDPRKPNTFDFQRKFVMEDGTTWSDKDTNEAWELMESIQGEAEDLEVEKAPESVGEWFDKRLDELMKDEDQESKKKMHIFKDFFRRVVQSYDGCDSWHLESFSGSMSYEECKGNGTIIIKSDRKYSELLDFFVKDLPDNSIRLNVKVTRIESHENEIKVEVNGIESFAADYVIFTPSLGVLKSTAKILFHPPLPERKMDAIEKLGFGTVNRLYLKFPTRWWPDDISGFSYGFFNEVDYEKEVTDDSPSTWIRYMLGIYAVDNREKWLCSWVIGAGARQMERFSDEELQTALMKDIRKRFENNYGQIPEPESIVVTRWSSDPMAFGSYSHIAVDAARSGLGPRDLAEPVKRLRFAGEATHEKFFSTVHGAIESGWREADRILNEM